MYIINVCKVGELLAFNFFFYGSFHIDYRKALRICPYIKALVLIKWRVRALNIKGYFQSHLISGGDSISAI